MFTTEQENQEQEIDNLIESISVTAGVEPDDSATDSEDQGLEGRSLNLNRDHTGAD